MQQEAIRQPPGKSEEEEVCVGVFVVGLNEAYIGRQRRKCLLSGHFPPSQIPDIGRKSISNIIIGPNISYRCVPEHKHRF